MGKHCNGGDVAAGSLICRWVSIRHRRHRLMRQHLPLILLGFCLALTSICTLNNMTMDWKKAASVERMMHQLKLNKRSTESAAADGPTGNDNHSSSCPKRNRNESTMESGVVSAFPADLFTEKQRRGGAIFLHFCGLVYMFVALAIVCDEFFVPSLGVITEAMAISDDVAGATFMAAGGSAPEFFTSLFGVFITGNNVGVGTIVGSATFNILCVLAFCTIFSRNVLALTWWPLFRDILFYSLALLLLSLFFRDELVQWPEALALFVFYLLYLLFMKYNGAIEKAVKSRLLMSQQLAISSRVEPEQGQQQMYPGGASSNGQWEHQQQSCESSESRGHHQPASPAMMASSHQQLRPLSVPMLHAGAHFPKIYPGIVQVALEPRNLCVREVLPRSAPSGLPRLVRKRESADHIIALARQQQRAGKDGVRKKKRLDKTKSLPSFNLSPPAKMVEAATTTNGCWTSSLAATNHRTRFGAVHRQKQTASSNGLTPINLVVNNAHTSTSASHLELRGLPPLPTVEEDNTTHQCAEVQKETGGEDTSSSSSTGSAVDGVSLAGRIEEEQQPADYGEAANNEEQPIDLSWPNTLYEKCIFLLLAPTMFPLFFTLPDVKKADRKKYAGITFLGSVIWIAFFTYLMVWWATVIGRTLGIPTEVIGLTILAAGTSIPDLITSVIVSRKGLGDMAVSSSIGSNLFDICVGLPVPWLFHFILSGLRGNSLEFSSISVESNGLLCSLGILFLMLIVLVASIAITRWRMNKLFGTIMLFAYVFFCIVSVLLEKEIFSCPLKKC